MFPVLKAFHEFGHGFAVKLKGGEVHDMGVMFLVLTPVPYVDASASYKYNDNLMITFDALNITNQHQYQYVDSVGKRLSVDHSTGAEFYLGVKYTY